jgi:hypothetical protein
VLQDLCHRDADLRIELVRQAGDEERDVHEDDFSLGVLD